MALNIADLLEHAVDLFPDRVAVACGEQQVTYAELEEHANRLAHHLAAHGVGTGSHVGLCTRNSIEAIEAMVAVYKLRAVIINVNYRYTAAEIKYVLDNADVVALVHDRQYSDRVAAVLPETPKVGQVVVIDDGSGLSFTGVPFAEAMADGAPERDFDARSADDLYILYTGGTTGAPKGVMWRHEDIWRSLGGGINFVTGEALPDEWAQSESGKITGGLVRLCIAPLIHGNAQWAALAALFGGDTVVLEPKFDAHAVWRAIQRRRVNVVVLIGDAMARPIIEAFHEGNYDPTSVYAVSSSAALFSQTVKDEYLKALPNVVITDAVGSSESGFNGIGMITKDTPPTTHGPRVTLNSQSIVIDDQARPVEPGSGVVGRMARTGHIPLGYYKDPVKTAEMFVDVDGQRYTVPGDLAILEADGTMTLLGRGNTCVNTGGEKVFPEEVEGALKSHPAVFDALVVGVPDERLGQRVAAIVQPRAGATVTYDELSAHARNEIAGYKVPKSVWLVDEVRRMPTGKPDYRWANGYVTEHPEDDLCAPRSATNSA
ncbi:MAG: 3-oxocholest-4-en-26-oate---CoA ligase [Pseudonocardiales bacterium]|nr:3-oxocholest-4-en-26-oate---CoA ligase [Pseudonocardiales bacterium]